MAKAGANTKVKTKARAKAKPVRSLPDAYGDSYLIKRSPTFRRVRSLVCAAGYEFVSGAAAEDHFNWPLAQLAQVLKTKKIPYRRNARVTRAVLRSARITMREDRTVPFTVLPEGNAVLHESAHAIADRMVAERWTARGSKSERLVAASIVGEACASATEMIVAGDVTSKKGPPAALVLNSFIVLPPPAAVRVQRARRQLGASGVLEYAIYAYILVNLGAKRIGVQDMRFILKLIGRERVDDSLADALFWMSSYILTLSPKFIAETSEMYFRVQGCSPDISKIRRRLLQKKFELLESFRPAIHAYVTSVSA